MNQVKFNCKIITPMFMTGADGKTPELRPSEFKGMMRFWWRAVKAEDDIKKLRKEEAEIFGGTGEGEGKSKVRIIITSSALRNDEYFPLPHKKNFKKYCYGSGSEFEIKLKIKKEYKELIENTFIIACILGGFGNRSRRGFGSISIKNNDSIELNYILKLLNNIENCYQVNETKILNRKKGGNYPWIKEIEIGRSYQLYEKLLEKIGQATSKFRDPSLGNAKPRMASPIYVSVIRDNTGYKPIITTLNSNFPPGYTHWNFNKQDEFKMEILK